ncbi:hypothetical protein NMK71_02540 [Weeksellaceae bacterium KMM 9713]|uniref:Lipoprotein n=1 Tax=Profundicola chukchiensis TaxID=2961959 RepID=A0A9X4N294_9FLAO|nr:hypothetical protein [Profundicola chukchiensis]MDG4945279.1 hypothetical protein [Profundicola chukchiensis]
MKIIYAFAIVLILGCSSNKYKADYYVYGKDKERISFNTFQEKLNSCQRLIVNKHKTDSGTIQQLLPLNYKSNISPQQVKTVYASLSKMQGRMVSSDQYLVINYLSLFKNQKASQRSKIYLLNDDWRLLSEPFISSIKEAPSISQFSVNAPNFNPNITTSNAQIHWIEDKDDNLRNIFSIVDVPYGCFILMKPSGEYYINYAEYTESTIRDKMIEFFGS